MMQTFSNIYYSTCHDYYAIIVTLLKQYPYKEVLLSPPKAWLARTTAPVTLSLRYRLSSLTGRRFRLLFR